MNASTVHHRDAFRGKNDHGDRGMQLRGESKVKKSLYYPCMWNVFRSRVLNYLSGRGWFSVFIEMVDCTSLVENCRVTKRNTESNSLFVYFQSFVFHSLNIRCKCVIAANCIFIIEMKSVAVLRDRSNSDIKRDKGCSTWIVHGNRIKGTASRWKIVDL